MTTQHTPGDWEVFKDYGCAFVYGPGSEMTEFTDGNTGEVHKHRTNLIALVYSCNNPPGCVETNQEANARLIAAAPKLLVALKEMVIANHGITMNPHDERDPVCRAALELASAAIAEAEGAT